MKHMKAFKKHKTLISIILTLILGYAVFFYFYFSPITDNAFVIANIQPVSSQVPGIITKIYIHNGENVKKDQPLFKINKTLYEYDMQQKQQQLLQEKNTINLLKLEIKNVIDNIEKAKINFQNAQENYNDAKLLIKQNAIAKIKLDHNYREFLLQKDQVSLAENKLKDAKIKLEQQKIIVIQTQTALNISKYRLQQTTIYAKNDGTIANMFIAIGSPVEAFKPVFSLIVSNHWYIQANFKETDLSHVKVGDTANVRLKMYLGDKIYKGTIISKNWAVSRQNIDNHNYLQKVSNNHQWMQLAQRFPVLIKINHPDSNYPLLVGASAYVSLDN